MKFLMSNLLRERVRWPLWIPVCLGCGVGSYFGLPAEPPFWVLAGLTGLGTGLVVITRRHVQRLRTIGLAVALVSGGIFVAQLATISVEHTVLAERSPPGAITGQITKIDIRPKGGRVVLDNARSTRVRADKMPDRVRLQVREPLESFQPGDWVTVRAVITPPPPPSAPGAFDFQRHLYFQGIGATGFALGKLEKLSSSTTAFDLTARLNKLRQNLSVRIRSAIDGQAGAVAAALMTGDRYAIPEHVLEDFRKAGLAHLLAISGLHVGLIAGLILLLVRRGLIVIPPLALRYPVKKWASAVAILAAFAYALVAGATIPTQRAFIMIGLVLVAVILDREGISMRLVAWAALVVLLLSPEAVLGPSFQLSFAAVIALIAVYESWRDRSLVEGRGLRSPPAWLFLYLGGIMLTSLIASLATAPFALYHFNRVAVAGLLANAIAVPVTGLWIMPWAIGAFLLMPFGLENMALIPMGKGIDLVMSIARETASLDFSVLHLPAMPTYGLILVALGGLWLCLWRRRWRYLGIVPIMAGLLTIPLVRQPDLIVGGSGKLFAVIDSGGSMYLSSKTKAKFTSGNWVRRAGFEAREAGGFGKTSPVADLNLHCDAVGCVMTKLGQRIALVTEDAALRENCRQVDIVVSATPVPWACPSAITVIDRFDLWRNGAHAIWLTGGKPIVKSVNE